MIQLNVFDTPPSDIRHKKRLEDAIKSEFVTILNPGQDKYGRILCDLQTDKIVSVSDHMLAGGLDVAKPYGGGKKEGWV